LGIKIINGRSYHPQTQGSVERANQTLKRRLRCLQREQGFPASHWVSLLPELAIIINTTTTRTLPGKKTPFEVWFGRKPRWMHPDYRATEPAGLDDLLHDNEVLDPEDPVLTEIETRVAEYNTRRQAQMVKQSKTHGHVVEFEDGAIATLKIPIKMRLKTKSERLPVRVLSGDHGQYKLMSQHGRLVGRWPADELNEVDDSLVEHLGASIPMEPAYKAGKEVTVQLAKAVAAENHRGSITAAQKAGRATALRAVSTVVPASSPPLRRQEQTPIQRPAVQRPSLAPA
jgi:hypothetical protein